MGKNLLNFLLMLICYIDSSKVVLNHHHKFPLKLLKPSYTMLDNQIIEFDRCLFSMIEIDLLVNIFDSNKTQQLTIQLMHWLKVGPVSHEAVPAFNQDSLMKGYYVNFPRLKQKTNFRKKHANK